jgi:hypothetical protein
MLWVNTPRLPEFVHLSRLNEVDHALHLYLIGKRIGFSCSLALRF